MWSPQICCDKSDALIFVCGRMSPDTEMSWVQSAQFLPQWPSDLAVHSQITITAWSDEHTTTDKLSADLEACSYKMLKDTKCKSQQTIVLTDAVCDAVATSTGYCDSVFHSCIGERGHFEFVCSAGNVAKKSKISLMELKLKLMLLYRFESRFTLTAQKKQKSKETARNTAWGVSCLLSLFTRRGCCSLTHDNEKKKRAVEFTEENVRMSLPGWNKTKQRTTVTTHGVQLI